MDCKPAAATSLVGLAPPCAGASLRKRSCPTQLYNRRHRRWQSTVLPPRRPLPSPQLFPNLECAVSSECVWNAGLSVCVDEDGGGDHLLCERQRSGRRSGVRRSTSYLVVCDGGEAWCVSERAVWVPTTGPTGGKVPVGVAETLRLTFPAHARPFRDRAVTEGGSATVFAEPLLPPIAA